MNTCADSYQTRSRRQRILSGKPRLAVRVYCVDAFYMHKTSGRLQRFTVLFGNQSTTRIIDERALDLELHQKMGTDAELDRQVKSQTLFDKSMKSKTMQASKFAK